MTGPAGGSSPLDLAALDVMIAAAEHTWGRDHELVATLRTVLALLRETRAALRAGHDLLMASSDTQVDRSWAYWDARALAVLAAGGGVMAASGLDPMHVARMLFAPELLIQLTRGTYEVIANATPAGTQLRGVSYDAERGAVSLMVEHPSFPASAPGDLLPILPPPVIRALLGAAQDGETPGP